MSNKQNDIISDMEMEDMFGKGGAEEVEEYYKPETRYCQCHNLYNPDCSCKAELRRDKDKVCLSCFKGSHEYEKN